MIFHFTITSFPRLLRTSVAQSRPSPDQLITRRLSPSEFRARDGISEAMIGDATDIDFHLSECLLTWTMYFRTRDDFTALDFVCGHLECKVKKKI
jgi:hypothetical protein